MMREYHENRARLAGSYQMRLRFEKAKVEALGAALSKNNPKIIIANGYLEIDRKRNQLNGIIIQKLSREKDRLASGYSLLKAHNPLNILDKGYALVYDEKGQLVKEAKALEHLDKVRIRMKDGERTLEVHNHGEEKNDL